MDTPAPTLRFRQPWLFVARGQLSERLSAETFAEIPASPGVYRFYGEAERLLYIGQSLNLRARVGSYRFVASGSHSRRWCRMAARIRRLEWQPCDSTEEAIALEARLQLEDTPPFNRAGVWLPPPWWMQMEEKDGRLEAHLTRGDGNTLIGPLRPSFRFTFAALMRCAFRWHWPETTWWNLPCGMARPVIPLEQSFPLSERRGVDATALRDFITTGNPAVIELILLGFEADTESSEGQFWMADADQLRNYSLRQTVPTGTG